MIKKSVSSLAFILAIGFIVSAAIGQAQAQKTEIDLTRLQTPGSAPSQSEHHGYSPKEHYTIGGVVIGNFESKRKASLNGSKRGDVN